jgi:hypothetical protein
MQACHPSSGGGQPVLLRPFSSPRICMSVCLCAFLVVRVCKEVIGCPRRALQEKFPDGDTGLAVEAHLPP